MKNISAVIIDTYEHKNMAEIAINMMLRLSWLKKIYTFSDSPFSTIDDSKVEFVKIQPIQSMNEYSATIFKKLIGKIKEDYFFVFQWDGFPVFPDNWDDSFCNYDYVGAPLEDAGGLVGNGGFSLRSNKLLKAIDNLGVAVDISNTAVQSEDWLICVDNRVALESIGINFAPPEVGSKFSIETGLITPDIFGFHGSMNFPFLFQENSLIPHADEIIYRTSDIRVLNNYLINCKSRGMRQLLKASLVNFRRKPNLLDLYEFLQVNNPSGEMNDLFLIYGDQKIVRD